jgi:hypothetical protein
MISENQFTHLFGGLHATVLPYNRVDAIHRSSLNSLLGDIINYEAKVHDAPFDRVGFRNVLRMLAKGKAKVLFFPAAWDACAPHIVGATFNFQGLSMKRNGKNIDVGFGLYTEDVSLFLAKLRDLHADMPLGCRSPEISIGQFYEQESLRYFTENGLSDGVFPVGRVFEFAPKNTKIIRIQNELGATLGSSNDSGLLRIEGLTPAMRDSFKVPVDQFNVLLPNGTIDPDNFVVAWQSQDGEQKIYTAFTNGMSTFTGKRVTQCQIITNGNIPRQGMVESVVASSLAVGEHKIHTDSWNEIQAQNRGFSPSIPLLGSAKEMYESAFAMSGHEIAMQVSKAANDLEIPTHIHVNGEPEVLDALNSLGAKQRMLGSNPMQTGKIDLTDRLEVAGNAQRARLRLIDPMSGLLKAVA